MYIGHVGIWVKDLELMKNFYIEYFDGKAGDKYENYQNNFSSYFISFTDGTRIELMHRADEYKSNGNGHIAFTLESRKSVDDFYEYLKKSEISPIAVPRQTGDGYYEFVFHDPEMNTIEITTG